MNPPAFSDPLPAPRGNSASRIALVIGNGPSVDQIAPAMFSRVTSYGCNHIGRKFASWGASTDHVLITDSNRIAEIGPLYKGYSGGLYVGDERYIYPPCRAIRETLQRDFVPLKQLPKDFFSRFPWLHRFKVPDRLRATIFSKDRCGFSLEKGFNFGSSVVTSAIQLAAMQGNTTILLTGVDSHYRKPKDYFGDTNAAINYVNYDFVAAPRFFMEPILVLLQLYLEQMGVRLIDCTPGGALQFIAKGKLTGDEKVYETLHHALS